MIRSVIHFMESRGGYATMGAFKEAGIHTRNVRDALDRAMITGIKPGLYKLNDYPRDEYESIIYNHTANANAVTCRWFM